MIHQEVDFVRELIARDLGDAFTSEQHVRAARNMHENHGVALQHAQPLRDIVEMHVHADLRALLMVRLEERALGDHDLRGHHIGSDEMRSRAGIAGVCDQRNLERIGDRDAAILEFAEFFLREIAELGLQLGPLFVHDVTEARTGVFGFETLEEDVVLDLVGLIGKKGDQFIWRALTLEIHESGHHAMDVIGDAMIADDLRGSHALKPALRAEVGERADVIHMSVRDRQMFARKHRARTGSDIKSEIELGDADARRLTGDGFADDSERRNVEKTERIVTRGRLGNHRKSPSQASACTEQDVYKSHRRADRLSKRSMKPESSRLEYTTKSLDL